MAIGIIDEVNLRAGTQLHAILEPLNLGSWEASDLGFQLQRLANHNLLAGNRLEELGLDLLSCGLLFSN